MMKNTEYRFHVIWEDSVRGQRQKLHLKEKDLMLLMEIGRALEQDHSGIHENTLELLREQIHKEAVYIHDQLREKQKICYSLGIAGGLFVVIILI